MKTSILISLVVLAVSCSGPKKATDSGSSSQNKETKSNVLTKDSIFLSFERTICFGECPAYLITIYPDGNVVYQGKKFVERIGTYHATITKEQADDIMREADRIHFFELKDKYDASVSDVPSTITILSGPNGLKRVINRFNGPEELRSFEKYLDSVLLNLDWMEK